MTTLGVLQYNDSQATSIKFDITGSIDKGFFLADNEWTCYRRNYFSCICSYTLSPNYPGQQINFIPSSGPQTYPVRGFAMSISAVVSDSDSMAIDLVQHTPKRDKGPVARPEKVRLQPKPGHPAQYPQMSQMGMYAGGEGGVPSSKGYDGPYAQSPASLPAEHTFERIQFKQATANNGKRRAAQQFYHILIELYADVGEHQGGTDQFMRIGYRKSAKMIVRGRSPGHYQSERRGSSGSGPSAGSGLGEGYSGSLGQAQYGGSSNIMTSSPYPGYERHPSSFNSRQHPGLPLEPTLTPEENKEVTEAKGYQYYPQAVYDDNHDVRSPVEVFQHQRDANTTHSLTSGIESGPKIKSEFDNNSVFYPGSSYYSQRCGRYEGKTSSNGFYPSAIPPPSMT
jgi:meiosis-specific transcription factor NDT80